MASPVSGHAATARARLPKTYPMSYISGNGIRPALVQPRDQAANPPWHPAASSTGQKYVSTDDQRNLYALGNFSEHFRLRLQSQRKLFRVIGVI